MNHWISTLPAPKVEQWIAKNGQRAMERHHTDDPHFALWLHYLDRATASRIGMSYQDLEDWDFWAAYDGDQHPTGAAINMLENLGYGDAC